jgi:hypothetical protein
MSNPLKIKEPKIEKGMLDTYTLRKFQKYAMSLWINSGDYDSGFGRHNWANTPELNEIHAMFTERAKEFFESDTLKPSWNLLVVYEGRDAKLWKHKDDNACTYHIDFCVFQKESWDLWVEDKPYTLEENDGLYMYGNDQEHWRSPFPNPKSNLVCNAFFFFCEPDHWYFTEGPQYLYTHIRAGDSMMMKTM